MQETLGEEQCVVMTECDLTGWRFSGVCGPRPSVVASNVLRVGVRDGRRVSGHVELTEVSVFSVSGRIERASRRKLTSSMTEIPLAPAYLTTCPTSCIEYVSASEYAPYRARSGKVEDTSGHDCASTTCQ